MFVPLRGKQTRAVALSCLPVKRKKQEVKTKNFKLKKIGKVLSEDPVLNSSQIRFAFWIHFHYLSSLGLVFRLFFPSLFLKRKTTFSAPPVLENESKKEKKEKKPLLFWQENRLDFYLQKIKKFKEKGQVLILASEKLRARDISSRLKKEGINHDFFDSSLKGSTELKIWEKVKRGETKVVVGTRSSIFLPFFNLSLLILDPEESPHFKSWDMHPKYHTRTLARVLCKIEKAKLILGTSVPSLESYLNAKKGIFEKKFSGRNLRVSNLSVVDMKKELKDREFTNFSRKLEEEITSVLEKREKKARILLFINRRGLSTSVFCQECGWYKECEKCTVPMVFHQDKENGLFICHHCGKEDPPPEKCPKCDSWKMKFYGAGTQKIAKEVDKKLLPGGYKSGRLDSDIASTEKSQRKIIEDFKDGKFQVLVATQSFTKLEYFNFKERKLDFSGIMLLDPLLSLGGFRGEKRALEFILKLNVLSKKILVQTYAPEANIIDFLQGKTLESFLDNKLREREVLSYPPFSEVIQLTFSHRSNWEAKKRQKNFKKRLKKALKKNNLEDHVFLLGPAPGFVSEVKGKHVWHLVLKVKNRKKKTKKLLLKIIPRDFEVDVNPESLL